MRMVTGPPNHVSTLPPSTLPPPIHTLQEAAAALQLARERLVQARSKKAEYEAAAHAAQKTSAADTRAAAQASAELDAHSKAVRVVQRV
jgi:hypothetical protein